MIISTFHRSIQTSKMADQMSKSRSNLLSSFKFVKSDEVPITKMYNPSQSDPGFQPEPFLIYYHALGPNNHHKHFKN